MHEDTISKVSNAAKGKVELLRESKARYLMSAGTCGIVYWIWNYAYFCNFRTFRKESSN